MVARLGFRGYDLVGAQTVNPVTGEKVEFID